MESLLVWVVERVAKFPREHRFTVGDRLIEVCVDVLSALVEASFKRDKAALLAAASRALVRARVLARVARRLRLLTEAQQLHFVAESDEVGKMVGGWHRSVSARPAPRARGAG
ncbi:MAG: four helix bundle protein [Polyangiaceae bacterium]|nr:four helix bundle protein [Polyangiaceae bacterium]